VIEGKYTPKVVAKIIKLFLFFFCPLQTQTQKCMDPPEIWEGWVEPERRGNHTA
jgi:hypothetical protein